MFKSKKITDRKTSDRQSGSGRISKRKIIDIILIILFVFAVVYIGTVMHKATATVSEVKKLPEEVIRLQLISPCKNNEFLKIAESYFSQIKNEKFEVVVVEKNCTDIREIQNTIIISRDESNLHARLLADFFGFNDNEIINRKLENNKHLVSVTLILGDDIGNYIEALSSEKESKE